MTKIILKSDGDGHSHIEANIQNTTHPAELFQLLWGLADFISSETHLSIAAVAESIKMTDQLMQQSEGQRVKVVLPHKEGRFE